MKYSQLQTITTTTVLNQRNPVTDRPFQSEINSENGTTSTPNSSMTGSDSDTLDETTKPSQSKYASSEAASE